MHFFFFFYQQLKSSVMFSLCGKNIILSWSVSIRMCSFVCKGYQTTMMRVVFPHPNETDACGAFGWILEGQIDSVVSLFFSLLVITTWIWNVFVSPTILLRRPHYGFFTLHPLRAVSEFTFVAEVWPVQHRRVLLRGWLIQTFQPKCFNSHEGKK